VTRGLGKGPILAHASPAHLATASAAMAMTAIAADIGGWRNPAAAHND